MTDPTSRDPVLITEQVLRAIAPSPPSEVDREVSVRLWEEARRVAAERGPRPGRSPYEGTVLRRGEPEPIAGTCIGSENSRVCVPAVDGLWVCAMCGERTMVTPVIGPREPLCDCRPGPVCVHPVPRPTRRASPPARETR